MSAGARTPAPSPAGAPPHETRDVASRRLLVIAAVLVACTAAGNLAIRGYQDWLAGRDARTDARTARSALPAVPPPAPRLQAHPAAELAAWRAVEVRDLERLGWVDRSRGIVRIPIERAMEILAARGLPARGTAVADSARSAAPERARGGSGVGAGGRGPDTSAAQRRRR